MKRLAVLWGEQYLYHPSLVQKILSFLLLPLSWLYCLIAYVRYRLAVPKRFGISVVSIGNLTVGGSGKTPLVVELAKHFTKPAIVLRGYGRETSGLLIVKDENGIRCDVNQSGDEAMLYAQMLNHAVVIVSEKREDAIDVAKSLSCDVVFLDDGYGKHRIQKLDIVINVATPNRFCLPSGAYRERLWRGKRALIVKEGVDFKRRVSVFNPTDKMVLVTAIARPQRLDSYVSNEIERIYFEDHHLFTFHELDQIVTSKGATSLLVTRKDYVKMSSFNFNFSILELELELDKTLITTVKDYVHAAQN